MKILFLASGSVKSNFSYRIMALARGLKKLGHEPVVIAPGADKYNNFTPEPITVLDGVRIVTPFQFSTTHIEINLLPYIFSAALAVLRENPDLIYIYKPTPITIVGFVGKIFRRTPVILDMDDLGSEVMRIEGHPWHQRALVAWCERIAARYADRLVVASTFLFEKYRREFPVKPIHIMPNGVEADWFALKTYIAAKKEIVFMGSINRKNILDPLFKVLPKIFKAHPDAEATIIGDGRYLEYFKRECKALGIEKNVYFTGWLPLDEARNLLFAGDIGYNYMPPDPTVKAASNMKVPQYMARGVIPIVSDVGDLAAAVDFGKAGYVAKADDTSSLEAVLLTALEDRERIKKSERARAFSERKFNWDNLARAFNQWNLGHSSHHE